jgi:dethiobiotin synthetase
VVDNIYVVGTDTGAGKTVLSLLLMQYFYEKGLNPFYLKPVQTGCRDPYDVESDAGFIYQNVGPLGTEDPGESVIYCFKNPKAPYFAARDEKKAIDMGVIQNAVKERSLSYSPVIIEAAGGLLVPITKDIMIIDTIEITGAVPIIAARAGLGTINHTLLTIEALNKRGIGNLGVVFIDSGKVPTPRDMIAENIEAVEEFSGIKVAGVVGKIENFSRPERDCYQAIKNIFGE